MKFIALIPARKGSKRIKGKNIKRLNKKPLIYYTIKQSLACSFIKRTIVLTDCKKIKKIAEKFGAEVPFLRPNSISKDKTDMLSTVNYCMSKLNFKNSFIQKLAIVLLPPTSPLRDVKDINNACLKFKENKNVDSLVTTYKIKEYYHPSKIMYENNNFLKRMSYDNRKTFYVTPGPAILITKAKRLKRYILGGKILNFVMPRSRSIDINYLSDFNKVEKILKLKKNKI